MDRAPHRLDLLLPLFLFPMTLFPAMGCASKSPTLTLQPADRNVAYAQKFEQIYAAKSQQGSWSFVLVSDEASEAERGTSTDQAPLRQVVHVKILWRPMNGTGRDTSCANAAIDWYVLPDTDDAGGDLLLYQGCGHVTIDPGDKATKVKIRSATLRPSLAQGNLADPLGESRLSGKFVAINDSKRLQRILTDTRTRTATVASSQ